MPLNSIELNAAVIADLYTHHLVEENKNPHQKMNEPGSFVSAKEENKSSIKYLGEFKKNVLLVVNYPNVVYLPEEQLNFLTSILNACKLSLGDVAIINLAGGEGLSYKNVFAELKAKTAIMFGVTPTEFSLPLNFPEFQVQSFNNCVFLCSPILDTLQNDKLMKSKFWVCLRKIFEI